MVGNSSSCVFQQQSLWESIASGNNNCMISPAEHRQHEFLPVTKTHFRASPTNLGLNGLGFSPLPERDHMHEANGSIRRPPADHCQGPFYTPNEYFEEQTSLFPSTCVAPSPQQKKFVIFDQCGNDMRLIFSSLCAPVSSFGAQQFLPQQLNNKQEQTQVCIETPIASEESGENETVDEGGEMREDTDEINALLYSDDEDTDAEDDEVSTGHSPFAKWEEQDFDEVVDIDISSKRQKVVDGGSNKVALTNGKQNYHLCENAIGEDSVCSYYEEFDPTVGIKRPRKDNIRDTLRALKSIMPDVKSKDPLVILEEAISYLKTLKSNAQIITMEEEEEDPDSSSCYGPSI